ncbi:MAG TPA: hypothetical protein PLJ35_04240 [Anaerolineae bacterium]|nr:hypothetical protein [Anaerolineae bacterium]HPL29808.1 hypothetical protein [Anaerolineae bacterium]
MQAATRRNVALLALGVVLVLVLWLIPGLRRPAPVLGEGFLTPQPTPTVESRWKLITTVEGQGGRDLYAAGWQVSVPGPWRVRAVPANQDVLVRVLDRQTGDLFAKVWAGGDDHGDLATLPQGRGTYSLQIEAGGAYTLHIEAWEAPQR